jgi:hypothetical protein
MAHGHRSRGVQAQPRNFLIGGADPLADAGQPPILLVRGRRGGIHRDHEAGQPGVGEFPNPMRLQQPAVGDQHHLGHPLGRVADDRGHIRVQRGLAPGQDEVRDAMAGQDLDRIEGALALDRVPLALRQPVAREVAEAAISIAGVGQSELAKAGATFPEDRTHRGPDARATRFRACCLDLVTRHGRPSRA